MRQNAADRWRRGGRELIIFRFYSNLKPNEIRIYIYDISASNEPDSRDHSPLIKAPKVDGHESRIRTAMEFRWDR